MRDKGISMFYPEEIVEEVRTSNDIVDVISQYVQLKRAGGYYKGLCPFHHEKTPSFTVTPSKQIYHCFGCGAGGNVLSFIMKIENLDFVEALKLLADRVHIVLPEPEQNEEALQKHQELDKMVRINREAARYFYYYLHSTKGLKGMQYFKSRNLSPKTIKKFGLGYSGEESDGLYAYLKSRGYSPNDIEKTGLIIHSKNKKEYFDRFRDRVIFPIFDLRKQVIGFGGRILGDRQPKYLNSPESILFNKSQNLYGLHIAKNSKAEHILIVEGYMDVISLHQAGFDQAVASLGTALTYEQAKLLKRYTKEVILCYDSDEAGRKAAVRAIDMLQSVSLKGRVINVPNGKDPDEFVKKQGAQAFQQLLQEAIPFIEYKISLLKKRFNVNETEEKVGFVKEFVSMIAKIKDSIEKEAYIKKISEEMNISEEAMYNEMYQSQNSVRSISKRMPVDNVKMRIGLPKADKKVESTLTPNKALQDAQKQLLKILIHRPYIYHKIQPILQVEEFPEGSFKNIATKIIERTFSGGSIEPAHLINFFTDISEQEIITSILSEEAEYTQAETEKAVNDAVKTIKLHILNEKLKEHMKSADLKAFQQVSMQISELKQGKTFISIYERKE